MHTCWVTNLAQNHTHAHTNLTQTYVHTYWHWYTNISITLCVSHTKVAGGIQWHKNWSNLQWKWNLISNFSFKILKKWCKQTVSYYLFMLYVLRFTKTFKIGDLTKVLIKSFQFWYMIIIQLPRYWLALVKDKNGSIYIFPWSKHFNNTDILYHVIEVSQ